MSRGKRYDPEQKLNMKKVFAVIIAFIVIIMFIIAINSILKQDKEIQEIEKTTNYFSVYTNGKWGVIDSNGDYVIQATYDEMIVVPNKEKDVFLCIYDVDYSTGEYKTKAINKAGSEILSGYNKIEPIENCDSSNIMWYEQNVLKVEQNGKYGLIDFSGNVILPCEYDKVYSLIGYKDRFVTVAQGKYGLCDNSGNILVNNECDKQEQLEQKCVELGINLELAIVPSENGNPKNIGKWHISKDMNSSYYTDLDN